MRISRLLSKPARLAAVCGGVTRRSPTFSCMSFSTVSASKFDKRVLQNLQFTSWTDCQSALFQSLGEFAAPRDILLHSMTGSGKTIAYLLPLIQRLISSDYARSVSVVIVPTRELAVQVGDVAEGLVRGVDGVDSVTVCGGVKVSADSERKGQMVIVGTPGALINNLQFLIGTNGKVETVVVDEVDRLLDFGFISQLERILHIVRVAGGNSPHRPSLTLVSATFPEHVQSICDRLLTQDAVVIRPTSSPPNLTQRAVLYEPKIFFTALHTVLRGATSTSQERGSVLVIFPTTRSLMFFYSVFRDRVESGITVKALHGRMLHTKRMQVMEAVRNSGEGIVLFTTDVAARGLDLPNVSHVIQVGLSGVDDQVSQFIHRSGRTARSGADGENVLMIGKGIDDRSDAIEELLRMIPRLDDVSETGDVVGGEAREFSPYQRHLSTKALESLLSWYLERRKSLGLESDSSIPTPEGRWMEQKGRIVRSVTELVLSTGVPQPRISQKLASKLRIDDLPGLLVSKVR